MTPDQLFVVALAGLFVGLLGTVITGMLTLMQARATHREVNSRMTELLRITRESSLAEGRAAERDESPS